MRNQESLIYISQEWNFNIISRSKHYALSAHKTPQIAYYYLIRYYNVGITHDNQTLCLISVSKQIISLFEETQLLRAET